MRNSLALEAQREEASVDLQSCLRSLLVDHFVQRKAKQDSLQLDERQEWYRVQASKYW